MARSVVSDAVYVGSGNVACRKYPFILPKDKYIVRGCTTIVVWNTKIFTTSAISYRNNVSSYQTVVLTHLILRILSI